MTKPMDERSRAQILEFLPDALATALESYSVFLDEQALTPTETGEDGKPKPGCPSKFKAHHDACKVAIAHIELLIKLGAAACTAADDDERMAENIQCLQGMMDKAVQEVIGFERGKED